MVHTKNVRYVVHTKKCPVCVPHQTCHVEILDWRNMSGMCSTPNMPRGNFRLEKHVRYVVHTKHATWQLLVGLTVSWDHTSESPRGNFWLDPWLVGFIHQNLHIRVFTIFRIRASSSYVSVIYALLLFPAMASIRNGMLCVAAPPRCGG